MVGSSDGKAKRLTSGSWSLPVAQIPFGHDAPFTWSPDGKSIVLVKLATPYSGDANHSTLEVLDVASGNLQPVTGRPKYESNPYLSPDGNRLAYLFPHEGKWQNGADVYVLAGNHGEGTNISSQIDRDMVRLAWMPDNRSLLVGANDHTTVGLWVLPLDGKAVRLDLGNVCPSWPGWWVDLSVGPRGDIAFAGSEPQHPMELYYLANTTAKPSRLTDFNTQIASLELGRTETIEWTSTDGFHEDGSLTYPPDFSPDRRYPLVLFIHGGPPAASHETFSVVPQLMAAQGWLVFEPNYRGSDNLGHKYEAAIFGDAGAGPGCDVMAGIQEVEKRGFVDKANIAVNRLVLRRIHDNLAPRALRRLENCYRWSGAHRLGRHIYIERHQCSSGRWVRAGTWLSLCGKHHEGL